MGKKKKNKKEHPINFNILNFNETHFYLFNVTRYKNIIQDINDLNDIKLNNEEINIIEKEIDTAASINDNNQKKITIKIIPEFFDFFGKIKKFDLKKSEYSKRISFIIDDLKKKNIALTLKQIAKQYEIFYGKKISITTVFRILKYHIGMKYLKTSIKNPKLDDNNYLFMTFIYIRIFLKSLLLDLNIIYLDETGFLLENNNYFTWRGEKEVILDGPKNKSKERLNLILAVSKNKIIHRQFIRQSIDTKIFIGFLEGIIQQMTEEEKRKMIIVMDNATFHIGYGVINFFKENKIKGLTICPYRSNFNMTELVFRHIKNITYKNIYKKMDDLKNSIESILISNSLQNTLVNLYKETLQQYLVFLQDYNWMDLSKVLGKNKIC